MLTRRPEQSAHTPDKGKPSERAERKATGLRPTGYGRRAAEGGWHMVSDIASANAARWPGGYPGKPWPESPLRRSPLWQWSPPSLLALTERSPPMWKSPPV